ncbi:MAG: GxxExxY protein [Candidatus Edwardsbacteria bacterium]|nr:GxxExxY protein [Candidatus Edwardsbacteria bacterium]
MAELLYKAETYSIIGAAIEVHTILGCGFLEAVYQEALCVEFTERGIPYVPQPTLSVTYKNRLLNKQYQPDFVVFDKIIVELKALDTLTKNETAQLLNYLKASKMRCGLLLNFGSPKIEWKRYVV